MNYAAVFTIISFVGVSNLCSGFPKLLRSFKSVDSIKVNSFVGEWSFINPKDSSKTALSINSKNEVLYSIITKTEKKELMGLLKGNIMEIIFPDPANDYLKENNKAESFYKISFSLSMFNNSNTLTIKPVKNTMTSIFKGKKSVKEMTVPENNIQTFERIK